MPKEIQKKRPGNSRELIDITYYTDPLCCWSWAMEPHWSRLQGEFASDLRITYKMAGLLPSWGNFNDTLNDIRRPIHMGPEWMYAGEATGVQINSPIWLKDPPTSSFPSCIAVKSVELQDRSLTGVYLKLLREAIMLRDLNIARTSVLYSLAAELSRLHENFNLFMFREDLLGSRGRDAFRLDWQETQYKGIKRLPTLVFRRPGHKPKMLQGYQTFEALRDAVLGVASLL